MQRPCEVCSGLQKIGVIDEDHAARPKIRRVLIGDRIVALCDAHANQVKASHAPDTRALRAMFMEPGGERSLIGRRSPLDRRIFPARPEGRRRSDGRRREDA
jgi:hypothetical protein